MSPPGADDRALAAALTGLTLALAGYGGGSSPTPAGPAPAVPVSSSAISAAPTSESGPTVTRGSDTAAAKDPCALVTTETLNGILGATVQKL